MTWDVAGTNTAALAPNVRISLSTDGGLTFPTVLAASTPNDGSQAVLLPDVTTSTARIKVEAVGNYFFDVNDANFSISPATDVQPRRRQGQVHSARRGRARRRRRRQGHGQVRVPRASRKAAARAAAPPSSSRTGKVSLHRAPTWPEATTKGHTLTMTVTGTNKGKAGYTLVVVAVGQGQQKDKIRVRLLKGTKLVYDSMPGGRPAAKPRTKIKGHITVS